MLKMLFSSVPPAVFGRSGRGGGERGERQDRPMMSPPASESKSPGSAGPAAPGGTSQLKSPSRVRTNFPETWIWADEIIE